MDMTVYRWENEGGEGPYVAIGMWELENVSGVAHDAFSGRPSPNEDSGYDPIVYNRMMGRRALFGFADREQESRWFKDSERAHMREKGFNLMAYHDIAECVVLGSQVIFIPATSADRSVVQ
jgi:hypothetical protein